MKYCLRYSLLFLLVFANIKAFAKNSQLKTFDLKNGIVKIKVSKKWRATKDLFGMPLTLSGPMVGKARPIITITPTNIKKIKFDLGDGKKSMFDYKQARARWLKKYQGKVVSFDQFENLKLKEIDEGYRVGYSYIINGIHFSEASYYLVCKKQLYHLKYLIRKNQSQYLKEIKTIIRSFSCE